MDYIIEFIFEVLLEGSYEIGSEKSIPMPIRIICLLIVLTAFGGLGGIMIYPGYELILQNDIIPGTISIVIGFILNICGIFVAVKMFRKKKIKETKRIKNDNKEIHAIVEKPHTLIIIVGFLLIFYISIAITDKIQIFYPDINVGFCMPIFSFVLIFIFVILMDRFLEFKEVLSATFYDDHVVLKRGKKKRTIPYNKIKKVVKYMIINRIYEDKGHYRVVIRCKGKNYVMYSGEDAELKLDFELTQVSKIYYEFRHRGIMCC